MMGGGRVQFGGRVGFEGYLPGELNVTARGEEHAPARIPKAFGRRRRRPDGARQLQGADARRHRDGQERHLEPPHRSDRRALRLRRGGRRRRARRSRPRPAVPLRFDIQVLVPSTLRIENNLARLVASADLQLRGTYDRPLLFGRAEVDRGEVTLRGAALSGDARRHRLHQPVAHRAVLRRRGRDAGARAGPDLPRHRPRRRHDGAAAAAARARIRRCPPPTCWRCSSATSGATRIRATRSCARCRTPTSGSATS